MEKIMRANGFSIWNTGGNCLCYGKANNKAHIMVTDNSGDGLPQNRIDWLIGVYDAKTLDHVLLIASCDGIDFSEALDIAEKAFNNTTEQKA